jgi:predicted nucleic acid-binding protein
MTPVLADSSYYIALLSPRDQHHEDAIRLSASLRRPVVVTEFVLIELTNAMSSVESRNRAIALWSHLQSDPTITIIPASTELLARGRQLYSQRIDKEWSLTDCISFVVMQDQGLTDALTADHHFEQAGLVPLLRN